MYDDSIVTYFAETDSRNKRVKFGIKAKDRTKHVYVIGKTGMGKSTVLENMAVQDIQNGEGMAFIDPHGKTADLLLDYIPEHRKKDVVYFAPFDLDYPISFNVLEQVDPDKRHLVVSGLMSTFKKIWQDAWSARMEYILTNTLLALLEYPGATLLGVNRMYSDKEFRKDVVAHITDPTVKAFWTEEFAKYTDKFAAEATPAIQNKIGQFTSNALIRNMIGQPKTSFDLRKIIDEKKILIINLSKGRVGEQNANLLGGMLITKIYLAAMSRADASPALMRTLPQFYLYVDEFQSFANESFADILSEARKYKLNLTMAHQYIEQMEEEVREGIEIQVSLPHKRIKGLVMLSGGERALTAIALLFAMSQVNPPPFIILDETDAALDEANSKKYGDMVENLAKRSQLIVITHNRETMSRAGILYGVTMGIGGGSKLLSVAFDQAVAVAK